MNIRKFLFIQDEFVFDIDISKFKSILLKDDFPKFSSKFENGVYVIESKFSVGILIINGYKVIPISTNAKISGDNQKTIVNLNSSIRPEYFLIAIAFILSVTIGIVKDFGINILWLILLFTVMFFWFKMVLQSQERNLHQNIKQYFESLQID